MAYFNRRQICLTWVLWQMSNTSKCVVKQITLLAKKWKTTRKMDGKLSSRDFSSLRAGLSVNLKKGWRVGESGHFGEKSERLPIHKTWKQKPLPRPAPRGWWESAGEEKEGDPGYKSNVAIGAKSARPLWEKVLLQSSTGQPLDFLRTPSFSSLPSWVQFNKYLLRVHHGPSAVLGTGEYHRAPALAPNFFPPANFSSWRT